MINSGANNAFMPAVPVSSSDNIMSTKVNTNQTVRVNTNIDVNSHNHDNLIHTDDGSQFTMTTTSNTRQGICIHAQTNGGLTHSNDDDVFIHYQVVCTDIISQSGYPITFNTLNSSTVGIWLDTTYTFQPIDSLRHYSR